MPAYTYRARDPEGKLVRGILEAATQAEVSDKLYKMGYMTTQVGETRSSFDLQSFLERFRPIRTEDRVAFNLQLANLIHAGISILQSLHTLEHQIENKRLKQTVGAVSRGIEAGQSFSEALAAHPKIFPPLFVSMVRAGEASGRLDVILRNYAAYTEAQAELEQKIRGALFYPTLLLTAGVGVMLFIVTFLIPQFAEIFTKVGIPLPLPTQVLYSFGTALKKYWWAVFILILAMGIGLRWFLKTARGRLYLSRFKLGLPVLGLFFRRAAITRLARTLGMLIQSGVPILQSLEMVKEVIGNEVLARIIANARQAVEKGEKLSDPLRISREFPPDMIQMIAVGEETGNLDEMLAKIADFYDRSVQYSVKKMTTVLEPLLLLLMGGMIGLIMASMLLPMFDMIKILRLH